MIAINPFKRLRKMVSRSGDEPVWRGGVGEILLALGDDGGIVAGSKSAAAEIGVSGRLAGRSFLDFVERADRRAVMALIKRAASAAAHTKSADLTMKFRLLRVRRAMTVAELSMRSDENGRVIALIRECVENENTQLAPLPAQDTKTPIEAAALSAELAHELKTPLNAIIGFSDAIRAETYGALGHEKYGEYIEDIHASGEHLLRLVTAALDVARIERGVAKLALAPASPARLAIESAAVMQHAADAAGLSLQVDAPKNLRDGDFDERVVKQILINLMSNAIKFTKAGEIAVSVREHEEVIEYTIRDTGVGMNKVVLAKLGGRWSDTHQEGVRGTQGAGLGLSLAFDLARAHGGVLDFESTPGVGTVATLRLPIEGGKASTKELKALDIQSQFDRVSAYRRERSEAAA